MPFIVAGFFIFSWPFIAFPLTDGDIVNWVKASVEVLNSNNIWGANDQAHGPLLPWMGALSIIIAPSNFYLLNFFNLVLAVLGIYWVYKLTDHLWGNPGASKLAAFLMTVSLAPVYLSRTPMYDWPAAILYLGFCYGYTKYLSTEDKKWFLMAVVSAGIGSMLRFSIVLGLSGFYLIIANFILRRSLFKLIADGCITLGSVILFNMPWFLSQVDENGQNFIQAFIYDNTGRFVKSTRPNAVVRKDYYGFPLYVLIGLLPFTFSAVLSFFNRYTWQKLKTDKNVQLIVAMFLPCLLLFTFSGHTKLGRYIAYVFPFIFILKGYLLNSFFLHKESFRKACKRFQLGVFVLLSALLAYQAITFSSEVQEGPLFVGAVIFMLLSLLLLGYYVLTRAHETLSENSQRVLAPFIVVYVIFFSILAYESKNAPFLITVEEGIRETIGRKLN